MSPIVYIGMDRDILVRTDLSDKAKMLLGLVRGMNAKGLTVANDELAEVLCIHENSVSRLLTDLGRKNLVKIENPQSRFRRVYSNASVTVEGASTQTLALPTQTPALPYSNASVRHKEVNKRKKGRTPRKDSFGDFVRLTVDEHRKLIDRFGEQGAADRIGNLDERIGAKGYKYKSHYHALLSWERDRRGDRPRDAGQPVPAKTYPPGETPAEKLKRKLEAEV